MKKHYLLIGLIVSACVIESEKTIERVEVRTDAGSSLSASLRDAGVEETFETSLNDSGVVDHNWEECCFSYGVKQGLGAGAKEFTVCSCINLKIDCKTYIDIANESPNANMKVEENCE